MKFYKLQHGIFYDVYIELKEYRDIGWYLYEYDAEIKRKCQY